MNEECFDRGLQMSLYMMYILLLRTYISKPNLDIPKLNHVIRQEQDSILTDNRLPFQKIHVF